MNKELFNQALQVEQLEDRFEMTTIAADAERCDITITIEAEDVDLGGIL